MIVVTDSDEFILDLKHPLHSKLTAERNETPGSKIVLSWDRNSAGSLYAEASVSELYI